MTTIAFITDQHFDVSRRFEETVRVHNWIADDIAKRKPDVILLGGDLFERRSVPDDRNAAEQWLLKLAETAEVVAVYGNHCLAGDLDVFNDLKAAHPITVYDRPALHRVTGLVNVACLPWPRKAQLLAATSNRDIGPDELNEIAGKLLENVLLGLGAQAREAGGKTVFLGHCMMRGSRVATGQPLAPGADFELGLEGLGLVGALAYFLGHIHMFQEWSYNGAPVFYGGSSTRKTWGETEQKFYHIARIEDGKPVEIDHIPTPCTPMLLLEAAFSIEHGGMVWQANESLPMNSTEPPPDIEAMANGADIRLRYSTSADERDAAKEAAMGIAGLLRVSGAVDVKVEEVVIQTTRARVEEITAAQTIEEKLQVLWQSRDDIPAPERQERLFAKLGEIERTVQLEA